jgi:hypothetical protein
MQRPIISSALFHSDSLRAIPGNLLDKSVEARLASRPGYHRGSFAGERAHRGLTYAARGPVTTATLPFKLPAIYITFPIFVDSPTK